MGIKSALQEIQEKKLPWITVELAGRFYAISSRYVSSIGLIGKDCVQIPESKAYIRGLVYFRDKPARVLDLRVLLGQMTLEQDVEEFDKMIRRSKSDHLAWMETLENSVAEHTHFPLATDPHKCAFGKWYDSYRPRSNEVAQVLSKLNEPHKKLHRTAIKIDQSIDQSPQEAEDLLKHAREKYVSNIVSLLDELIHVHGNNVNELMLVMENDNGQIAVTVDRVVGVKELELQKDRNVESNLKASYALGIAKVEGLSQPVVLLDDNALFEQAEM